jgi:hypothetical protein
MIDGSLLPGIQRLAFGHVSLNIDEDDLIKNIGMGKDIGTSSTHVAGSYDSNFAHDL